MWAIVCLGWSLLDIRDLADTSDYDYSLFFFICDLVTENDDTDFLLTYGLESTRVARNIGV